METHVQLVEQSFDFEADDQAMNHIVNRFIFGRDDLVYTLLENQYSNL